MELEAPDVEYRGDSADVKAVVLTAADELGALQAQLQAGGYSCSGKLVNVPMTTMECSAEDEEANYNVIDKLEELDDVDFVEHNMAVS